MEKGFDKLFGYDRPITETFEYCNTMKNGSISDQLEMQERQITREKENKQVIKEKKQIAIQKEKKPKRGIRR